MKGCKYIHYELDDEMPPTGRSIVPSNVHNDASWCSKCADHCDITLAVLSCMDHTGIWGHYDSSSMALLMYNTLFDANAQVAVSHLYKAILLLFLAEHICIDPCHVKACRRRWVCQL